MKKQLLISMLLCAAVSFSTQGMKRSHDDSGGEPAVKRARYDADARNAGVGVLAIGQDEDKPDLVVPSLAFFAMKAMHAQECKKKETEYESSLVDSFLDQGSIAQMSKNSVEEPKSTIAELPEELQKKYGKFKEIMNTGKAPDSGVDCNEVLIAAASAGDLDVMKYLINSAECKSKLDVNVIKNLKHGLPTTALCEAIKSGNEQAVRMLLDAGANAKTAERGLAPLHCAAESGNAQVIQIILEAVGEGIKELLHLESSVYGNPLHCAAFSGNTQAIQLVLDVAGEDAQYLANCDSEYRGTSLHCVARSGNVEAVKIILKYALDVDVNSDHFDDIGHFTPLACAKNLEVAKELISAGAKVNFVNEKGCNILDFVLYRESYCDDLEYIKFLIDDCKLDINEANGNGALPLTVAAEGYDGFALKKVELLLQKGADINGQAEGGNSPLICAALQGNDDMVKFLLEKGAKVNHVGEHGETALLIVTNGFYSFDESHKNIVDDLVKARADLNHVNEGGVSALLNLVNQVVAPCTSFKENYFEELPRVLESISLLVANGANIWLRNNNGVAPIDKVLGKITGLWNPNKDDKDKITKDLLNCLIKSGVDLNSPDPDPAGNGRTVLTIAAKNNNYEAVTMLVDAGITR